MQGGVIGAAFDLACSMDFKCLANDDVMIAAFHDCNDLEFSTGGALSRMGQPVVPSR